MILPRRYDVDLINSREFTKLDGESVTYNMSNVPLGELPLSTKERARITLISKTEMLRELQYLMDNTMAKKSIDLKIGTLVMCVANLELEGLTPIVNGSQGIVVGFMGGLPKVKFNNDIVKIINKHIWSSENIPGVAISQIPLIYGWAITIHKAQGLTLDKAIIDLGNGIFECGQTYVALSRIKSLEGLYLTAFDYSKIKINIKVMQYYGDI